MAERVGVSVPTLAKLESGSPTTSLASMIRVLTVLNLAADLDKLAADDKLGHQLQDAELAPSRPTGRRSGMLVLSARGKPRTSGSSVS